MLKSGKNQIYSRFNKIVNNVCENNLTHVIITLMLLLVFAQASKRNKIR